jgi:flavin-binding protein dodecin
MAEARLGRVMTRITRQFLEETMPESVYKVIELVGTSTESWEKAAAAAVALAAKSLRDLRVAEVVTLDMHLEDGKVKAYRAKVKVSFKYEGGS